MKREESIYHQIKELNERPVYPFHMPGHKRNVLLAEELGIWEKGINPIQMDITEIPGYDDLHEAKGILKRTQERAARLYGAHQSFLQVNGSTGAILAAVGGATQRGDFVLMARNCHKSVYHAIELFGLNPLYLQGKIDDWGFYKEIESTEVERAFQEAEAEEKRISLVIVTSPTYEGLCSDIRSISEITHQHQALLLVDEAHGAHFGFRRSDYFPETAVRLGADMVVQSLHKTLPSFTQTALLHLTKNHPSLRDRVKRKISCLMTSSPSYLMMANMENCLLVLEEHGDELFHFYEERLKRIYQATEGMKWVKLWNGEGKRDKGKLVISAGRGSGSFLYEYFYKDCRLVMEMKSKDYVIAMTSVFDDEEGMERLLRALNRLEERLTELAKEEKVYYTFHKGENEENITTLPEQRLSPAEAVFLAETKGRFFLESLEQAEGKMSSDYVYFYPPGIPLIIPGEIIDAVLINKIREGVTYGITIYGGSDGHGIFVCADGEECDGKGQHL